MTLLHQICFNGTSALMIASIRLILEKNLVAAGIIDASKHLPLHYAVQNTNIGSHIISDLTRAYPEGCSTKDSKGRLPIHLASTRQNKGSIDILRLLLDKSPKSIRETCKEGELPLHYAVDTEEVDIEVLKLLCSSYRGAMESPCSEGLLPLHRLVMRPRPDLLALEFLSSKCPKVLGVSTDNGRLPLHIAVANVSKADPTEAVAFLIKRYPQSASIADKSGNLPIHIAVDDEEPNLKVAAICWHIYFSLFQPL